MPLVGDPLFAAILAMDSYNRGSDAGLIVSGNGIGDATLKDVTLPAGFADAGFFAQAYTWNGETVISYRGTDVLPGLNLSLFNPASWTDVAAWSIWAGANYSTAQAQLAVQFFRTVQSSVQGTIEITGHSLGGALAGFVSSLFGVSATTFDNIDFRRAAEALYQATTLGVLDEFGTPVIDDWAKAFFFGQANPTQPDFSKLTQFALQGDIAQSARSDTPQFIPMASGLTLAGFASHSQALLVLNLFASRLANQNFFPAEKFLFPKLFDDALARAVGFVKGVTGSAAESNQMLTAIAYSAIASGVQPFGNTAVQALFDDANDLGVAVSLTNVSKTLIASAAAISSIIGQFAGQLAKGAVTQIAHPEALSGVLTLARDQETLSVNLDNALWSLGSSSNNPRSNIVGLSDLIDNLSTSSGGPAGQAFGNDLRSGMKWLWGSDATDIFGSVQFATQDDPLTTTLNSPSSGVSLFVAGGQGNKITGSSGDDLIYGGAGNDELWGGGGNDLLAGGAGDDILHAGTGHDYLAGGDGIDTADFDQIGSGTFLLTSDAPADSAPALLVTHGDDRTELQSIEKINLVGNDNTVVVRPMASQPSSSIDSTMDLGATLYSSGETLDFSQYGKSVYLGTTSAADGKGSAAGLFNFNGMGGFTGVSFAGMTILDLGAGDDTVNLTEAADPYLHTINTGGGKDTITSGNINVIINLQGSDDTVLHAGMGSIINIDPQTHATIELSDDVLVNGAKATDSITVAGQIVHGAIGSANSESGWVTNGDGVYYGLDASGLEIRQGDGTDGSIMYVAGYNGGPGVPLSQQTGGIFIGVWQTYAWQLFNGSRPSIGKADTDFKAANDLLFTLGLPPVFNADPLVLDLTGSGINLTSVGSDSPMLDINADGFVVHTGWVGAGNGILVDDKNGNGLVDNASEMFGGPGVNGFAALAQDDTNGDGVIDSNDAIFTELKVWRDLNGDGVVNPGEMESLADAGIAAINLSATAQTGVTNAGNTIMSTGTFTRTDGTTSAIDDVSFNTDPFHSTFAGDTSVSAAAAAMPNIKGYGTLTDLQVAMTLDPGLIGIVNANLGNLNNPDLNQLRAAAMPIFTAWAAAVPLRDAEGNWHAATPASHPGLAYLTAADSPDTITDFAYQVTVGGQTYWKLASGNDVLDSSSDVISQPTLSDVLNQYAANGQWTLLSGDEIAFMERYRGVPLPLDSAPVDPQAMISAMSGFISASVTALNLEAVRLAMQGPLASYFQGLSYDTAMDKFHATTDQQLTPMFEQIFEHAPADASGAAAWVASWRPLLDIVLGDLDRGALSVSYAYMFQSMVRAYEAVGLPISIAQAGEALGVPAGQIIEGGSAITGPTGSAEIYYLHGGDQTVTTSSLAPDNFVMGGTFGNDVIDADRSSSGDDDLLRFTNVRSTDVTANRDGIDLILTVNGTNEQIRMVGEFIGIKPGLIGGNQNDKMGVQQIVFSDGVVWDKADIAAAVSHPQPNLSVIIGTDDNDVLDGGVGGDTTLIGGNGGDTYIFGRGYGHDTIDDQQTWIFNDAADIVKFKPGIALDDLQLSRDGNSNDLNIFIKGTTDELTILNQFAVAYNIWNSETNRIEMFDFSDGTELSWEDVIKTMDAQAWGQPAIYGFNYADTLDGGPGVHYLSGGNEDDTYLFDFGYTYDIVQDATTNILSGMDDTIAFGDSVRPQDVTFSRLQGSQDLAITLSDGSTMVVKDEFATDVDDIAWNRIENFQFADGTVITFDQLRQQLLSAVETSGNDVIAGTDYADVLDGGAGNDYLAGGKANAVYVFGHGYGHDTIDSVGGTVAFNPDISLSDIEWSKLGSDLVIKLKGSNDSVTVLNEFGGLFVGDYIGAFQFADGTVLSRDDVYTLLMQGTGGDDTINASYMDPFAPLAHQPVNGGPGDDVIIGTGGDTIDFDAGDGRDAVADPRYTDANTIDFGAAITPDMVHIHQLGTSLVFTFDGTNDRIAYVGNQAFGFPIGNVVFADGTTWTTADIQARMEAGASLTAIQTGGTYEYDYNLAQGYAIATPQYGQSGTVTIRISGILPSDVDIQRVRFPDTYTEGGAGILISAKETTSGGLLIDNSSANILPFDQLVFDDGTVWTGTQVQQMLLDQAALATGNTTIYGFDGNDTITSGTGDDVLEGGKGNDTYVYRRGDGFDKIVVNKVPGSSSVYIDTLSLPDIASTEVSLLRWPGQGINDLVVEIDGTNGSPQGQITIADEFNYGASDAFSYRSNPSDAAIQQIAFSDGVVWSEADIEAKLLAQEEAQAGSGAAIYGFDGADTLSAGTGARTLVGGLGSDTYVWTAGDGPTWISDQGSVAISLGHETNTLEIKGVAPSDVTVTRDPTPGAHDLILTIAGQNPIVLQDQTAASSANVIQNVVFDDGTTWSATDLLLMADGGIASVPDGVTARSFDGMAPNTTLAGTASDDVYFWGGGDGNDAIAETDAGPWAKADVLRLRGLNLSDVTFGIAVDQPNDLIIIDNATGERLTVTGQFSGASTDGHTAAPGGRNAIERLIFADGTVLNAAQILDNVVYIASPGDDTVRNLGLGTGSIPLVASPGVHTLIGDARWSDNYLWTLGDGNIRINDYGTSSTTIDTLRLAGLASGDVSILRSGSDLLIQMQQTGETITVSQEFSYEQGAGIERIVFADGTVIDLQKMFGVIHTGQTATFEKGDGQAVLTPIGGGVNLQMAQDISPSDVILQSDAAGDLIVKLVDAGDSLTVMGDLDGAYSQLSTISFGDGSAWNLNQSLTFTWIGSAGNTALTGSSHGSNVFVLAAGSDTVTASSANDVFVFDKGDGQANVTLHGGGTLRMASDILASDVILQADAAGDLTVRLLDTGDTITFAGALAVNGFGQMYSQLGAISFGDGNSWDMTHTWVAGAGDKYLARTGSSETYVYSSAGGNDIIDDGGDQSHLVLDDIASTDVTLSRVGASSDLVLTVGSTGKTVTVRNQFGSSQYGEIQSVTFADGVVWTPAYIKQALLDQETAAASGNVYGYANSNDTMVAGAGDKYLNGEGGSDTYVYSSTGGNDVIDDAGSLSGLVFSDISSTDVTLSRVGASSDLVLTVGSTGKTVTVRNQFGSSRYGEIQSVTFADGVVWTPASIKQALLDQESAATSGSVYGYISNDTLAAGAGDKYLNGEGGSDTYVYSSAGGNDVIDDGGNQSTLVLSDISSTDVTLSRNGSSSDLVLTVGSTGKTVTVKGQFSSNHAGELQSVTFADGVVWTPASIEQALLDQESAAASGNVYGYANSNETLVAGAGDKYLNGEGGTDTYVYSSAGGNDVIDDGGSLSTLVLSDIASTDVTLSWTGSSNDLVLTVGSTGKTITVKGQFSSNHAGAIQSFTFSDGVSWNPAQILQILSGGNGLFNRGDGQKTLDASVGIALMGSGIAASDVLLQANGSDLVIALRGTLDSITIHNDLTYNWWGVSSAINQIIFADGTSMDLGRPTYGQGGPLTFTWAGTSSNTTLVGSSYGSNVFEVAPGGDSITFGNTTNGGDGKNTILFGAGDGSIDVDPNGETGAMVFGAGISATDLLFQANGTDLIVSRRGTSDSITIHNDLTNNWWGVSSAVGQITFADGTSMTLGRPEYNQGLPLTFTTIATSSNTTLVGSNYGSNVFDVAPGGDSITFGNTSGGGDGKNTIMFEAGDGHDDVNLNGGTGVIDFGTGISASDLLFQATGADLIVSLRGTTDSITIHNDLTSNWWGVSSTIGQITFADGTSMALGQPGYNQGQSLTFTSIATSSNTTLIGSNYGSNVFEVAPGGDSITFGNTSNSGDGKNTIVFEAGDGHDDVNLNGATGVIDYGTGISASDLLFQANGNDLSVIRRGTSDSITIHNDLVNNWWGVSSVVGEITFADGTSLGLGQPGYNQGAPLSFTWIGTANSTLTGSSYGSNTFVLGSGTESATGGNKDSGGNGNNIYLASQDTGQATIYANAASGSTNELDFANGISDQNLWFAQSGNDLEIDLLGTNTKVDVNGWFSGGSNQLQEITAGGLKIDGQISQLVQAMATYSASNSGFDPTSATVHALPNDTNLQSSLASAWHS
jgi:Ca2+-binding RTX toxin-like protein